MKRTIYYCGIPGKKWGIWNDLKKEWLFDICEDTPMLAMARLHQKIGEDARKCRFEPRQLPDKAIVSDTNVRNKVRHGRWEQIGVGYDVDGEEYPKWKCSECHAEHIGHTPKFCSECGAKMDLT